MPTQPTNKGLDSAKSLAHVAAQLVAKGYSWVARYYFRSSHFKDVLTAAEAKALAAAGLWVVAVYENGFPTTASYFTAAQGHVDAADAVLCAQHAGQPHGTPIYFAVDYDSAPKAVDDYFRAVSVIVRNAGYTPGIYGNGVTIAHLKALGLVTHGWLSQSTGFAGHAAALETADIVQLPEGTVLVLDVDGDLSHGHAGGWKPS